MNPEATIRGYITQMGTAKPHRSATPATEARPAYRRRQLPGEDVRRQLQFE